MVNEASTRDKACDCGDTGLSDQGRRDAGAARRRCCTCHCRTCHHQHQPAAACKDADDAAVDADADRRRRRKGFFSGVSRAYKRVKRGPRLRLLLMPAVVLCLAPLFVAAIVPVYTSVGRQKSIVGIDGESVRTTDMCLSSGGVAGCGAYRELLATEVTPTSPALANQTDAILVRSWMAPCPTDASMARVTFLLEPSGRYAGGRPRQAKLPRGSALRVSIGSDLDRQDVSVGDGDAMPIAVVDIHLVTGSLAHAYPHDRAIATVIVDAWVERAASGGKAGGGGGDATVREPVTLVWQATTVMALWETELLPDITYGAVLRSDDGARTQLMMTLRLKRAAAVKTLVWMIVVLMWLLSASMFAVAVDVALFAPREVEGDDVGVAIGLLFALPAIRSVMPDGPPLGSPLDAMSTIWNLSLVLIASLLLMAAWLGRLEGGVSLNKAARRAAERQQAQQRRQLEQQR